MAATYPSLRGRVALVTGGTSGIGLATARNLLASGVRVAVVGRDNLIGDRVAESLGVDGEACYVRGDLVNPDDVRQVVEAVHVRFDRIDVVVHSARWEERAGAIDLPVDAWDRTLAVHLRAFYLLAKHVIPLMDERQAPSLIAVSSIQAWRSQPGYPAYAAAKGGLHALVRQLAAEYGPLGIRVNAVVPGLVITDRKRDALATDAARRDRLRRQHPLGRAVDSEDVARLITFLASDEAATITGQSIVIDAGATLPLESSET